MSPKNTWTDEPYRARIPQDIDTDHALLDELLAEGVTALARIVLDQKANGKARAAAGVALTSAVRHATGLAKAPFVAAWVQMPLDQDDGEDEKVLLAGWHHDRRAVAAVDAEHAAGPLTVDSAIQAFSRSASCPAA